MAYRTWQMRRNTKAGAAASNPVLAAGEPGFETDTGHFKVGDGVRNWNDLPEIAPGYNLDGTTGAIIQGNAGDWEKLVPGDAGKVLAANGNGNTLSYETVSRTATYVVAASNAPAHVKRQADYVCDGTDDQVQIQAAIDLMHIAPTSGPRGTVFLSPGRYMITDTIKLYNGIGLVSELPGWSQNAGTIGAMLYAQTLDAPIIKLVGDSTYTDYDWFPYIENIHLRGPGGSEYPNNHGVLIEPEGGSSILDVHLINVMTLACGGDGFRVNYGGKTWFHGGYAENNSGCGVYFKSSGGGTIQGMYLYGNYSYGIDIQDSGAYGLLVSGNHIRVRNGFVGVRTYSAGRTVSIVGNEFAGISGTTKGIRIEVNDRDKDVTICGNILYNLTTGVEVAKGGYWTTSSPRISLTANVFSGTTTPLASSDFAIRPPYVQVGGNVGYVTGNGGAAASTADGGTIAHGCAVAPTVATVSGSVAGEIVTVTSIDATNITVAIKAADGSTPGTTQTVYWRAEV